MPMRRISPLVPPLLWVIACTAPALGAPGAQPPTPDAAPRHPAQPAPPAGAAGSISTADDLLRALETADKDIRTLRSDVKYMRDFGPLEPNTEDRHGTLYFEVEPARTNALPAPTPRRKFAVDFEQLIINGQVRPERRGYIFDGEWLVEKNYSDQSMVRRQVAPPGQIADPLRIGEGPFPLPIGQKREDILKRFTAELVPPESGMKPEDVRPWVYDTYQLRLVPREGSPEARDFTEVRLWYRKSDLLPRLARTTNTDGGSTEVLLGDPVKNGELPDVVFDTTTPPGWKADTVPFRQAAGEPISR